MTLGFGLCFIDVPSLQTAGSVFVSAYFCYFNPGLETAYTRSVLLNEIARLYIQTERLNPPQKKKKKKASKVNISTLVDSIKVQGKQ